MSETEEVGSHHGPSNGGYTAAESEGEPPGIRRSNTLRNEAHKLTRLIGSYEELEALIQRESEFGREDPQHQARYNEVRNSIDQIALRLAATPVSTISELTLLLGAALPYLALGAENEPRDVLTQAILACTMRLLFSLEGDRRLDESGRRGTFSWFVRGWRDRGN